MRDNSDFAAIHFEVMTLIANLANRFEGKRTIKATSNKTSAKLESIGESGDRRERFWNHVLFGTMLLWTYLLLCFPLLDTDFWWHLKTGEWILDNFQIPYVDLYTYMDSDKSWIDLHWGFQVLITVLYRIGGLPLVTLVKAAVYTGAVALAWRAGGANLRLWKKAALWLLPILCITGRGNERPEMLSVLFLAAWLWFATQTDRKPGLIWWLPVIQVVWVNCHALFVLGLVVGFAYLADAIAREQWGGRFGLETRTAGPDLRTIGIVGILVALACFVNPYFEEGAMFPLTLYRKFSIEKEFYSQNIGEFQQPIAFVRAYGLRNVYLLAEVGVWLLTAVSFVRLLVVKRRWSVFRFLIFAGYTHLAWQASRNTSIFALVSGFIACENFAQSTIAVPKSANALNSGLAIVSTRRMFAFAVLLCLSVISGVWNQLAERNKPFGLGETPNWFIHNASLFAGQPGFPQRAFVANNGQAEVFIYHNGHRSLVFMDARLEVCTQATFEKYLAICHAMATGSPALPTLLGGGELPVVVLDSRTSARQIVGMTVNPAWRLVYADRAAAVFLPLELAIQLKLPLADVTPAKYPDGP